MPTNRFWKRVPDCIICNIKMKLVKRLRSCKKYRIRRFECPVCGYKTTIFADGYRDLIVDPAKAVEEAQKLYPVIEDEKQSEPGNFWQEISHPGS